MTLDQLQFFVTLANSNTFLEAAEELNISQSSLSKNIKKIEDEIGTALFERTTRKFNLTSAGHIFYDNALSTILSYKQTLLNIKETLNISENKINIISEPILSDYNICTTLDLFISEHSYIKLKIDEIDSFGLNLEFQKNNFDLLITHKDLSDNPNLKSICIHSEKFYLLCSNKHEFSKHENISIKALKNLSLILNTKFSESYKKAVSACEEHGFIPNICRTGSISSIIQNVQNNNGIALLSNSYKLDYNNIKKINLKEDIFLNIYIYIHKKSSKNVRHLANFIEANYKK